MENINITGLLPAVAEKIRPMIDELVAMHTGNIHSFHIVGSAVIPDYNEKMSDINSLVVLHTMDLAFIKFLAPLGKRYGKKKIAAPLVMSPEYIRTSLDAFPIEFLDFKLIHRTLYGDDILKDIAINRHNLRLQCEREIKVKLIGLRQGYLSSLGRREHYEAMLVKSFTGSMALLRAIITLSGKEPPVMRADVIKAFGASLGIETDAFETLLRLKTKTEKLSDHDMRALFERYYATLEAMEKTIDGLPV